MLRQRERIVVDAKVCVSNRLWNPRQHGCCWQASLRRLVLEMIDRRRAPVRWPAREELQHQEHRRWCAVPLRPRRRYGRDPKVGGCFLSRTPATYKCVKWSEVSIIRITDLTPPALTAHAGRAAPHGVRALADDPAVAFAPVAPRHTRPYHRASIGEPMRSFWRRGVCRLPQLRRPPRPQVKSHRIRHQGKAAERIRCISINSATAERLATTLRIIRRDRSGLRTSSSSSLWPRRARQQYGRPIQLKIPRTMRDALITREARSTDARPKRISIRRSATIISAYWRARLAACQIGVNGQLIGSWHRRFGGGPGARDTSRSPCRPGRDLARHRLPRHRDRSG